MSMTRGVRDKLRRGRHWAAGKYREVPIAVAEVRRRLGGGNDRKDGPNPENFVWIFGSGRSGSSWLRAMMSEMDRHRVWEEPLVGRLFGEFHERAAGSNRRRPEFVMGDATRRGWIRSIRNFVLDGAAYAVPRLGVDDYLIIKEPNGSAGAPLLMEALPESRMILLIRDPRDVVASTLDGAKRGNWLHEWRQRPDAPDADPDTFVRLRAAAYVQHAGNAKKAFDAHRGRKVLIKYEDLRADPLGTLKRVYSALEISSNEAQLGCAVEKHAWENIPEGKKGEGKFYRKAKPGGWGEDLTPEQVRIVEEATAPLLKEFYP